MSNQHVQDLIDRYLVAYRAEDAQACALTFTPDGRLFSPFGPPADGRTAIAATHLTWFKEREENKQMDLVEIQQHGTMGHCLLTWSADVADPDKPGQWTPAGGVTLAVLEFGDCDAQFSRLALVPNAI